MEARSSRRAEGSGDVVHSPSRGAARPGDVVEGLKECINDLEGALGDEFLGLMLFGSWTRGEAKEDSDVDVLVALRSLKGMKARSAVYRAVARRVGRAVTLIDVRADELFKEELELTPLLLNALVDGVVIYDKTGKLSELASKARRLMEAAGLVRYRTPDGKYGWKRRDERPLELIRWPSG